MKYILCSLGISTLLISTFSIAGGSWAYDLTVKNVRNDGDNARMTFSTVEQISNPAACVNTDHYGVDTTNDPKGATAVLLTALVTGKKVDVFVDDTTCDINGRPSVSDVLIKN